MYPRKRQRSSVAESQLPSGNKDANNVGTSQEQSDVLPGPSNIWGLLRAWNLDLKMKNYVPSASDLQVPPKDMSQECIEKIFKLVDGISSHLLSAVLGDKGKVRLFNDALRAHLNGLVVR